MTQTVDRPVTLSAADVHDVLSRHMLADGFEMVLDLDASAGSVFVDARNGTRYLDLFTFFASSALGMNHPALAGDETFRAELLQAALNKPSNSDVYSVPMARFVDTFARVLGDPALPHLFFVEGGALAVENALKVAFDWKSRWNSAHEIDAGGDLVVLHLQHAFHGRSGYTMSLTNTDPNKTALFPIFAWPRISSPAWTPEMTEAEIEAAEAESLAQARAAFAEFGPRIACFIAEPVQGEGGDRHLRPAYLQAMQELCRANDALFVLDEVQAGCGMSGTAWTYQQLGLSPDVVAFGKKVQVCGIMAGGRVDEVPDNVFHVSSRINSTWGGGLADMVRARRILEVIESDGLIARAAELGTHLRARLDGLAAHHPAVRSVRGRGLMCAFTLPTPHLRDAVVAAMREQEHVLLLGCGNDSIRFRPALTVTAEELDAGVAALDRVLTSLGH